MSMSLGLGTNLKLSTSQKLTPQMQQAIRLLHLSSFELEQEVQTKLEINPMLEYEEEIDILDMAESFDNIANSTTDDFNNTSDDNNFDNQPIDSLDKLLSDACDDSAVDTSWDNVYTSAPNSLIGSSEEDLLSHQGSTSATIQDHVRWQINFENLSQIDNLIADYLIEAMDDLGFINIDIDDLHNNLSTIASFYQWDKYIDKKEILNVLQLIQTCEPLGVGARDLSECLSLQLAQLNEDTPYIEQAKQLLKHSNYLQTNNIEALLEETGLEIEDIEPSLTLIRTLNSSPAETFLNNQPTYGVEAKDYDIPDVLVAIHHQQNAEITWEVRLNPETLPKLRINQEYANLVKANDNSSDNTYLKENLTDARLFLRSIQERNNNLLKVATCIVKRQEQFLLQGAIAMQPLILKEVAEEIGLHESTVSRLTTNKNMLTPQGLYPLKYFFSSSVSSNQGEVSSTAICAIISDLVKNENPKKPLSDKTIKEYFHEQGIDIARRTIAKYRDAMNIGSSTQRRQKY